MATRMQHQEACGRARRKPANWFLAASLLATFDLAVSSPAAAEPPGEDCIVIDSDAALDDFRAVATLAPTRRVVAIVVTEGISRPSEGAGAIETLLSRGGLSVPVIPGASPDPGRRSKPNPQLEDKIVRNWRPNAELLNGFLTAPATPSLQAPGDIAVALRRYTAKCSNISLLVIGPWTSFMRYAAEILERVDQIVAQGRPYPDEPGGVPTGLNCDYDLASCYAAFDLLVGRQQRERAERRLRVSWIDIPNSAEACGSAEPGINAQGMPLYAFRPVEQWPQDLERAGGIARVVADVLRANLAGWEQTSLWDDLAALYLLRRDVFAVRGGHVEPCIPAASIRKILTNYMAGQ